ncbi:hypothetical protein BDR04DRAFT_1154319 [Suillus decipiens]|nr:hypothetical protein BDR04DRAFT_1154319 [Suillus decipiens]
MPPSKPTVKFRDLDNTVFDNELDINSRKRTHDNLQVAHSQDLSSDSEDSWLEENENTETECDPMYQSCDAIRVLAGNEDAHLDAPRLLDLLSEKPVEGATRAPQQQDTTIPIPSRGPVQWIFCQKLLEGGARKVRANPHYHVHLKNATDGKPTRRRHAHMHTTELPGNDTEVAKQLGTGFAFVSPTFSSLQ